MKTRHEARMWFRLDGAEDRDLHRETATEIAHWGAESMIEYYRPENKVGNDGPALSDELIQVSVRSLDCESEGGVRPVETDGAARSKLWRAIDESILAHQSGEDIEVIIGHLVEARRNVQELAPPPAPSA